jgi:Arm DNA-binding domain
MPICGFCVRMNARRRTFKVATSVAGQQFRLTLGYWPLMSVEEARSRALEVLRECRAGRRPAKPVAMVLPTLREALLVYCTAKGIKASSQKRYDSIFRTHFGDWLDGSVVELGSQGFAEHCHAFAQTRGSALVEVGRGIVSALVKYVNAVHGLFTGYAIDAHHPASANLDSFEPNTRCNLAPEKETTIRLCHW